MLREIYWGLLEAEYRLDKNDARREKDLRSFDRLYKRSQRLIIATLALGTMLLAITLEQQTQRNDIKNYDIGQLIQLLDDVR